MEWAEYRSLLCAGCAQLKSESMDPAMAHAYEAVPLTCHGCAARDAESRDAAKAKSGGGFGDSAFDGLYIAVTQRGAVNSG